MRSRTLAVAAVVFGSFTAARAEAAGLEEIDLQLRADPKCVERAAFTKLVASYGGSFADVPSARRTFDVSVDRGERIVGRLVIRDAGDEAGGVEDVRIVAAQTCDEVSRLLALLMAMALDGEPKPAPQPQTAERPWYYLLPKGEEEPDAAPPKKRGRQGSGGLAVDAFYGGRIGSQDESYQRGIHVYGGTLVGRSLRVGLAGAAAIENHELYEGKKERMTVGTSLRLGAMIGWGAPWNDVVAGFRAELGAMTGTHQGTSIEKACYRNGTGCAPLPEGVPRERPTGVSTYVTPYAAWSLVLQIPWHLPVRPIAGITGMLAGGPPGELRFLSSVDVGLVWQAW